MIINISDLILASGSKSRLDLLHSINLYPTKIIPPDIEEKNLKGESAKEMVERLSKEKCSKISNNHSNSLVISADTTAISKGYIMEKTYDEEVVRKYMDLIKGKRHKLYTSFCVAIKDAKIFKQRTVMSVLQFKNFSQKEIDEYIKTDEWKGCAGGYRIEGYIGRYLSFISGSYSNILGLPVYDLHQILSGINLDLTQFQK